METQTIRVWTGVYEAIQLYAKSQEMDASALASLKLMQSLFTEDALPEDAKTALARDFFTMLAEGIVENKDALAKWATSGFSGPPKLKKKGG
jgi:hypothetical protein